MCWNLNKFIPGSARAREKRWLEIEAFQLCLASLLEIPSVRNPRWWSPLLHCSIVRGRPGIDHDASEEFLGFNGGERTNLIIHSSKRHSLTVSGFRSSFRNSIQSPPPYLRIPPQHRPDNIHPISADGCTRSRRRKRCRQPPTNTCPVPFPSLGKGHHQRNSVLLLGPDRYRVSRVSPSS